ncbi:DUF948 domain-containing protein [Cytobacillus sp. FJAT-54145]|uniref:DUF948 domain-containing protein n=1 Tax=Cytobacillus spartinae TaxID=3299023 RepID=A0ABW6KKM9_9BACI
MEIILYLSAALAAIAFFILVIYLTKTLKSLQVTLDSVSNTLQGLEKQLDGVTRETTDLLHKTNHLADDIQKKSDRLNTVVDAVKDVSTSIQKFNQSIQTITTSVNRSVEQNKDKVSQVIQWSNVLLELKDKWKAKKKEEHIEEPVIRERSRGRE